jgi:hypothetical protein
VLSDWRVPYMSGTWEGRRGSTGGDWMRSDALLELRSGVMRPASRQPKQGVGGQEPSWEEVRTRDCGSSCV